MARAISQRGKNSRGQRLGKTVREAGEPHRENSEDTRVIRKLSSWGRDLEGV